MSEKSQRPVKAKKVAVKKKRLDEQKRGYGELPQYKKRPKFQQHKERPKGKEGGT